MIAQFIASLLLLAAQPQSTPCSDAAHRQFDFWVGTWVVHNRANKQLAGTNTVTRLLDGCVVQEHWSGVHGGRGTSLNTYDAASKRWHQTWVDNQGGLLVLDGAFTGGAMVLSGTMTGQDGKPVLHRITWTPLPGGAVRQEWVSSQDGGHHWSVVFDGIYTRR
jgi:hypothetical protein